MNYSDQLKINGYTVIPLIAPDKVELRRKQFTDAITSGPEYIDASAVIERGGVMGGFSALATSTSFHHPFIRSLRLSAIPVARGLVFDDIMKEGDHLEALVDRALYRPPGKKVSGESWHRDESSAALPGDVIYGGWVNLDDYNHELSCVPETHKDVHGNKGFAKIPKTEHAELKRRSIRVQVPPGCMLIFVESMIHEVLSSVALRTVHRLFMGWRITKSTSPLHSGQRTQLANMEPVRIKSGQMPPMYAKLHKTNWIDQVVAFSENIHTDYKEWYSPASGKNQGKKYHIVKRFMPPVPPGTYPEYTTEELDRYLPSI
jgi:hypothetical protein